MIHGAGAVGAIIVAAGKGSRMGLGHNKVLAKVCGKTVIEWTLDNFINSGLVDRIVLVISPDDKEQMAEVSRQYRERIDITLVEGGKERQDSVYNGLISLGNSVGTVLIHDGARPFVDKSIIERSIANARLYGAACAGMPVKDTIKIVDQENIITSTPERRFIWSAQTPQAFKREIILDAYKRAYEKGINATDDASIAEASGYKVVMFEGSYYNIKLTSPEDMLLAELFIKNLGLTTSP